MKRLSSWACAGAATAGLLAATSFIYGQSCGAPTAGSCCSAGGTAYCDDLACCELICAIDSFCCDTQWDGFCANQALTLCKVCGATPCFVDCLEATTQETELCGEDLNGGCDGAFGLVEHVNVGDVICGTYWAEGGVRDTDWFEFTTGQHKILTFSIEGELPTNLFLVTASCPAAIIASSLGAAGSCDPTAIVDQCLPAGTYRVIVQPSVAAGFSCAFESRYQLSIIDTGEMCTGVPGDVCENALQISEGSTPFSTVGAFTDGDPLPGTCASFGSVTMHNDIWFTFTPSRTALYRISTCNQATFDTRLAVYEGPCFMQNLIGCNDDAPGCAGFTSQMLLSLTGGAEYLIRLGGWNAVGGTGTLTLEAVEPCDITCPSGAHTESELCGEDTNGGCNAGGLYENIGVPTTICGTFWASGGTRDTDWYRFNLDEPAVVTLTVNSTLNVTIGLLSATCAPIIYVIDATQSCGATVSACLPAGQSVAFVSLANFENPPCGSGPLNQYTAEISIGEFCEPPVCGGESAGDCCVPGSTPFCNDATCCEMICAADPWCCNVEWDLICANAANMQCAACGVEPQPNDECADAIEIFDGLTAYTTIGASTSQPPLDPSCQEGFGLGFANDIWFLYTATCSNKETTFSTCGLVNYDSRLALYGGSCDNLVLVACNDDGPGCPGFSSKMTVQLVAGETYLLRVGGYSSSGSGSIDISCGGDPPVLNDACDDALPLTEGGNFFSTIGATGPTNMGSSCVFFGSSLIHNDIWFTWTATGEGQATISTCNSANFDTRLAVFSDCSLTETLACNDDTPGCALTTEITFDTECGMTYYVSVGAWSTGGFGIGTLTVTQTGTCAPSCPADLNNDGIVNGADLGILLGAWGPGSPPADLNGDGVVNGADLGILLGAWGDC